MLLWIPKSLPHRDHSAQEPVVVLLLAGHLPTNDVRRKTISLDSGAKSDMSSLGMP